MKKIIILGAGMIGSAIAADLAKEYNVTIVDRDSHKLNVLKEKNNLRTIISDLSSEIKIQEIIIDYDLVIGALPGFLGFKTLHSVIAEGKDIVDISFLPEDPFDLDELAKERNVTAVVDCGVSPGLSNIILGYKNEMINVSDYSCIVAGLPVEKEWPYYYKAFFSPIDVIEEYKRRARIVKDGDIVSVDPLSDPGLMEFEQIGKLEAISTDGLRTLLRTMKIPNMIEKTLRYPGHIELMKVLRETGYFDDNEIEIGRNKIRPIDLSAKLLFPLWKPGDNQDDFTLLKLCIKGDGEGVKKELVYDLFDSFDKTTHTSSMARSTGYTCSAVAKLILEGDFDRNGICPPEYIGSAEGCYDKVISYLEQRNLKVTCTENIL